MSELKLYRRRFIPDEKVYLKDDEIILSEKNLIITKWKALKKRKDLSHGASCYFLDEGFKVSKFLDENNNLLFWYCDIINYEYDLENNTYTFSDLLVDIIVYPDGFVKVVDLDEIADAFEQKIIDEEIMKSALRLSNKLLGIIYSGGFSKYTSYIEGL